MNPPSLKRIGFVCKRELLGFFSAPASYIILIVFFVVWEFLFFRSAFLVGEASIRILLDWLPWLLLLFIPAITMGAIAQERSEGTLEFSLTQSISDIELILGKFAARLGMIIIALSPTLPIALSFSVFGDLDWGTVVTQILASFLMSSSLAALGVFVSSIGRSQIAALIVATVGSFFWIVLGFEIVTSRMPLLLSPLLEQLSVFSHFESMIRGVVDARDFLYFLSAWAVWLLLAMFMLTLRRAGGQKHLIRTVRTGIALLIANIVLLNILIASFPLRIDLTEDRSFTLSRSTKKILKELPDVVRITLYASRQLPSQFQPVLRDAKDILRDYKGYGKGNVNVHTKDPSGNQRVQQEARSFGIREIQFNVVGMEEFQVKTGFLGLAIEYGGDAEAIPFIEDTADLEYQLTVVIRKMSSTEKRSIGVLAGHGEKSMYDELSTLRRVLSDQFSVKEVSLSEEEVILPEYIDTLLIAGPTEALDEQTQNALTAYIGSGGSVMAMLPGVHVNSQFLSAYPGDSSFIDFFAGYGATVEQNLVYDLKSNETVRFGQGFISYFVPYGFWVRALPVENDGPVLNRLRSVLLQWPSSIAIDEDKAKEAGFEATPLIATTRFGGVQTGTFSLSPEDRLSQENLREQVLAVQLEQQSEVKRAARMILVGNADFVGNNNLEASPENFAFALNAFSWLAQDDSLADLRIKQKSERRLLFTHPVQLLFVKYGNLLLVIIVPILGGGAYLLRRRRLRSIPYASHHD